MLYLMKSKPRPGKDLPFIHTHMNVCVFVYDHLIISLHQPSLSKVPGKTYETPGPCINIVVLKYITRVTKPTTIINDFFVFFFFLLTIMLFSWQISKPYFLYSLYLYVCRYVSGHTVKWGYLGRDGIRRLRRTNVGLILSKTHHFPNPTN